MKYIIPFLILIITSSNVYSLGVMVLNTEFLWDDVQPHNGNLIGSKKPVPTAADYQREISFYAQLINDQKVNIVGLVEIEGCHIANALAAMISKQKSWYVACTRSRDTFTGQHVAILSTLPLIESSITSFPDISYQLKGKSVRPSKVVGVVTKSKNGHQFIVITAHLISKRGNNDAKRQAQAAAIARSRDSLQQQYPKAHAIIMGDLNDVMGSKTLSTIVRGRGNNSLVSPSTSSDCSYVYRGKCSLIDHILISPSLSGGKLETVKMPSSISDHRAVVYRR